MPITLADHEIRSLGAALTIALKGLPSFTAAAPAHIRAAMPQLTKDFQVLHHRIASEISDEEDGEVSPLLLSDQESRAASMALAMATKALENVLRTAKRPLPAIRDFKIDCEVLDMYISSRINLNVAVSSR